MRLAIGILMLLNGLLVSVVLVLVVVCSDVAISSPKIFCACGERPPAGPSRG